MARTTKRVLGNRLVEVSNNITLRRYGARILRDLGGPGMRLLARETKPLFIVPPEERAISAHHLQT
jgi:hypothetical protein